MITIQIEWVDTGVVRNKNGEKDFLAGGSLCTIFKNCM